MEDLKNLKDRAENVIGHFSDLADTYYKLGLVKATKLATNVVSGLLAGIVTLFLFIITLFFIGMGLAWWLANLLNSIPAGFFIVAGVFILLIVLLIVLRRKIVFPFLKKAILKRLYE